MKLKTVLSRINLLVKEKKISEEEAQQCKATLNKVWDTEWQKHHLTGEKDNTPKNRVKIRGVLHYMMHTCAYSFVVKKDMLKDYLVWLKEKFGADIEELMKKIGE